MSGKNRAVAILRNAASNYVRQVLQIAVFVLLTPFIVRAVGKESFGLWSVIQATVGLIGLMDMGFSSSVVKFVAEARGKQDPERVKDLTASFFWQYMALGALTAAVTVGLVPLLPRLLDMPEAMAASGKAVFLLVGLRAALALPLGVFAGILVGFQQQLLSNITRTFGTVSYGALAWWALGVSPSIETLAWVSLATGVFANAISAVFCMFAARGISLSPRRFRWPLLREISAFSLWFFLIQVSLLIATRVDTIVINAFLPLAAVAVYTVAMRIAEQASVLCRQLTNALTPVIAELKGAGESQNIRAVFAKGSMLAVALAVPLLLGLAIVAEDLAVAWMGPEFATAATPCRLLLASALVAVIHSNTENVLSMTGEQRFLALATVAGQAMNLGLTLLLVRPYGLDGVAAATLAAQVASRIAIQRRAGRLHEMPMATFYARALGPSLPGAAACAAGIWIAGRLLPPTELWAVAVQLAAGGACFLPAFWYIGLGAEERAYYGGRLRAALKRRRPEPPREEATA